MLLVQDSTLHSDRDVEAMLHVPAIAMIPQYDPAGHKRGSMLGGKRSLIVTHEA
jgi:hypothetical protein